MKLYFDTGVSEGRDLLKTQIDLTPKLVSLSTNTGSPGGSIIVANVEGVGPASKSLIKNIVFGTSNTELCEKFEIKTYGKIECHTNKITVPAASTMAIKMVKDSLVHACANSDTTKCQYKQVPEDPNPKTTAVALTDSGTVTFTGENYYTCGYNAVVTFGGIKADTVTISTAISLVATWNKGVPTVTAATVPILEFIQDEATFSACSGGSRRLSAITVTPLSHFSLIDSAVTLTNQLEITSTTADLSCSYAGGCLFEVTAGGLSTLLQGDSKKN